MSFQPLKYQHSYGTRGLKTHSTHSSRSFITFTMQKSRQRESRLVKAKVITVREGKN